MQGLGKTIQAIAVLLHLAPDASAPSLVVAPSALLTNWAAELRRFAPSLRVHTYHGPKRSLNAVPTGGTGAGAGAGAGAAGGGSKRQRRPCGHHVVLTSYGLVRRDTLLQRRKWSCLVIDESQTIKNQNSGITKVCAASGGGWGVRGHRLA